MTRAATHTNPTNTLDPSPQLLCGCLYSITWLHGCHLSARSQAWEPWPLWASLILWSQRHQRNPCSNHRHHQCSEYNCISHSKSTLLHAIPKWTLELLLFHVYSHSWNPDMYTLHRCLHIRHQCYHHHTHTLKSGTWHQGNPHSQNNPVGERDQKVPVAFSTTVDT